MLIYGGLGHRPLLLEELVLIEVYLSLSCLLPTSFIGNPLKLGVLVVCFLQIEREVLVSQFVYLNPSPYLPKDISILHTSHLKLWKERNFRQSEFPGQSLTGISGWPEFPVQS